MDNIDESVLTAKSFLFEKRSNIDDYGSIEYGSKDAVLVYKKR